MSSITTQRPIHILSLDGGGVRGLSSLLLLRGLMERLGVKRGIMPPGSIRPCDCFDLIIGTGTGGISALFLGRLHMTVDEAIRNYVRMAEMAFKFNTQNVIASMLNQNSTLDGSALERVIGDIVKDTLGDRNATLEDPPANPTPCRTAVLAIVRDYADAPPHVFRSYSVDQPASRFSIVAAARATASTCAIFKPVSLGNPPISFVDAGISGYNNPTEIGFDEAEKLWKGRKISCIVSLGAGVGRIVQADERWGQVATACASIPGVCGQVHERVSRILWRAKLPYFRLNVERGLDDVVEWKEAGASGSLAGITQAYMQWDRVNEHLNTCVSVLNGDNGALKHPELTDGQVKSKKSLSLLPPSPEIFYGREEYIEQAVKMLLGEKAARLVILGTVGIGKTSMACSILHDHRIKSKFGEHQCFVSCEGIHSPALLVDSLCTPFDLHGPHPDRKKDLLTSLKHAYATKGLLLILDNLETVWEMASSEVEALLASLAQIGGISLLLTMRGSQRPAGLHWTRPWLPMVEKLSPDAAYKTYMHICDVQDEKLEELLHELDYIPLAVTLMAHLGQNETPSHLLKRWKSEKTRMLSQGPDQNRLKNVEVSIQFSIVSQRMQSCNEALVLLSVISLLPGGVMDGDLPAIAPKIQNLDSAVATLQHVGLAHHDSAQSLCVLSPIRLYVSERYPPSQLLIHDVETFYFQLVRQGAMTLGKEGHHDLRRTLQKSEANIEAILSKALKNEDHDDARMLVKVKAALDWTRFLWWFSPRDWIIQLAIQATEGKEEFQELYAWCLQSLGSIQQVLYNYEMAKTQLSKAQGIFEKFGNRLGVAKCLESLGNIHYMLEDHDIAQTQLSTAQGVFTAIGDRQGVAQCLQSLGGIQLELHNYDVAQNQLSDAQKIFEVNQSRLGAAQCLQTLGKIQQTLGQMKNEQHHFEKAQNQISMAKEMFESIGDRLGAAQCLRRLGEIQHSLGNYEMAENHLSTAQRIFETTRERLGVAQCLLHLGKVEHSRNRFSQAKQKFIDAQLIFKELGAWTESEQQECLNNLHALAL